MKTKTNINKNTVIFFTFLILCSNALNIRKTSSNSLLQNSVNCDAGINVSGTCGSSFTALNTSTIPTSVTTEFDNIVAPIMTKANVTPSFCYGDYYGAEITSQDSKLAAFTCDSLPFTSNNKYGLL